MYPILIRVFVILSTMLKYRDFSVFESLKMPPSKKIELEMNLILMNMWYTYISIVWVILRWISMAHNWMTSWKMGGLSLIITNMHYHYYLLKHW